MSLSLHLFVLELDITEDVVTYPDHLCAHHLVQAAMIPANGLQL